MKDNDRICAYDCFGEDIFVGDYVSCVFLISLGSWKNKHRIIIAKGKVTGWTTKRIDVEIKEILNNTDFPEDPATLIKCSIGDIVKIKPDKICKLGQ